MIFLVSTQTMESPLSYFNTGGEKRFPILCEHCILNSVYWYVRTFSAPNLLCEVLMAALSLSFSESLHFVSFSTCSRSTDSRDKGHHLKNFPVIIINSYRGNCTLIWTHLLFNSSYLFVYQVVDFVSVGKIRVQNEVEVHTVCQRFLTSWQRPTPWVILYAYTRCVATEYNSISY